MLSDPHAVSQPAYRTASPYQVDDSPLVDWIGSALSVEGAAPSLSTTDARVPKVAHAGSFRRQLCEQQRLEADVPLLLKTAEFVQNTLIVSAQGGPAERPRKLRAPLPSRRQPPALVTRTMVANRECNHPNSRSRIASASLGAR